ncbi:MAG: MarC family protein [Acidobacteria bacterium]|nr:MAG: MarC family protein [Acidobacteriota bacterium]REK02113.1 MAG: MarC family protein [Acidobacteriota bacterium]REK14085.1 MAG: MarC family protein [Acidobacteriota bacterium]REK42080.1 MAG: MarC family protein [Acidobacteriota bacterium]
MIDLVATFIIFFSVVDPIGTVPVFIAVTSRFDNSARKKVALMAILVAAGVLLFFVVAGELILTAMSIPLPAFQISGGIVLFLFALSMIFGESKPDEEVKLLKNHQDAAIYPLAVPSIAGPGAMLASVLLTKNDQFSIWEQAQTVAVLFAVLAVTYGLMLLAGQVNRLIGASGASVVSRVMGLILASVATSNTLAGVKTYFGL